MSLWLICLIIWWCVGFGLYAWSFEWGIKDVVWLGVFVAFGGPFNIVPALECKRK